MNNHPQKYKAESWWAPLWRGLVVDQTGIHCENMDGAVWLYLYLLLHADRKTGRVLRRYETIAKDMGRPASSIRRWLATLLKHNYVIVERRSYSQVINISKWKPLPPPKRTFKYDQQSDQI